ncbi:crotonobetainyl-CoA--carnitine CoA-transferase [Micromonospora sp. WMMD975]|uniref:crotonobetainyl-CoA--carnitine CoA-transferase n=1 Tax=Micromonospora sp. WMMD975 TaxID=3016087 RepID=UPI00249B2CE2|nr:crotonobetainyl-CoA--carnitine CoA-transferase [Micromonospora sp. WMMD975]WFE36383.1 crotonobetainyl-CoA--carnitine CoA-transferase [Micromonospora sp. WMMD975]
MAERESDALLILAAAADRHLAGRWWRPAHGPVDPRPVDPPAHACEDLGLRIAAAYERAAGPPDRVTLAGYRLLKAENLALYHAAVRAGVRVVPWRGHGQPYADSADLRERVRRTGTLAVYLTRDGHGPGPATDPHPMREPSPVTVDGVDFTHNDVFRAVHDLFGHVLLGASFGPGGEFRATWCHLGMYPPEAHQVLFAEQIGQICWFFYGPHLLGPDGRPRRPGDPGYLPPSRRPYPEQKVVRLDDHLFEEFRTLFHRGETA